MGKTFTTFVSLENYINKSCKKAIENASNRLLRELQNFINKDYYDMYEPKIYERTRQFYNSAVVNILSNTSAEIKMDKDLMNYTAKYKYLDGTSGHWTGEDQLYMADAGYHGTYNIYRDGHFWKDFEEYCNKNAINILKEELRKQGINVK